MPQETSNKRLEEKIKALEEKVRQQKKAIEAFRASEEKYRLIVENSVQGIFIAQDGQIRFANLSTLTTTGYTFEEISKKPFIEFIHPDDQQLVYDRHIKRLQGKSLPSRYAFRLLDHVGNVQWVELNVVQIEWEEKPATLNFMNNITQRRQMEDALRTSEEKFRSMVEASPIGIAIVNDQSQISYANEALCNMLEYEIDAVIGENFAFFLAEESRGMAIAYYLQRQKGEKVPDRYFISFLKKSGKIGFGEVQSNVFEDSGGRPNSIVQLSDITDRIESENERNELENQLRQAQKMESVGQLAGGVAHDFNNMLNVILGHTELAMETLDKAHPVQADLSEIEKSCKRSAELTQQLLAFARKQTIMPKILDLNDKVATTLKMLQRLIGEDKELMWIPGANLWQIKMDPAQIDQILANLAVNAHDAITGVGKVLVETKNMTLDEVYCSHHAGFVPGKYVMLSVSDNGSGMEKNILSHVFEPFFTTKEVGKGTGLGLATVYGIVKQNLGFINVYSEPGEGTTFKVYFPRFDENLSDDPKEAAEKTAVGGKETILMVEDEPAILSIGKSILEKLGYTVLTASTPQEAIQLSKACSKPIDLLITDVVMPEMNGKELAQRLMSYFPDLKYLYMSGYTANVIAHRGILDSSINFIQKPFSSVALDHKIREILQ